MQKKSLNPLNLALIIFALTSFFTNANESYAKDKKVYNIEKVLSRKRAKPSRRVRYCDGGRFQPCVCWRTVSKDMSYRPSLKECDGNAAIILSGKYYNSFSAVIRDRDNRDRWPAQGFNGCSSEEATSESPPAYCSAFKAQYVFDHKAENGKKARVHCLGASGYSELFKDASRITVKLEDKPNSSDDPLVRWCLRSPNLLLN
jgi:hypothetical protein